MSKNDPARSQAANHRRSEQIDRDPPGAADPAIEELLGAGDEGLLQKEGPAVAEEQAQGEIGRLRAELEEAKDRVLRTQAELENYRKRAAREILLLGIRPEVDAINRKRLAWALAGPVDWEYLLTLAEYHNVTPLLAYNLAQDEFKDFVPGTYIERLNRIYQNNIFRNML